MKKHVKLLSFYLFAFILTIIGVNNVLAEDKCVMEGLSYVYIIDVKNGVPDSINIEDIFSRCNISHQAINSYTTKTAQYITSNGLFPKKEMKIYKDNEITYGASETVTFKYYPVGPAALKSVNIIFYFGTMYAEDENYNCVNNIIQLQNVSQKTFSYYVKNDITKCVGFVPKSFDILSAQPSAQRASIEIKDNNRFEISDISKIPNNSKITLKVRLDHNGVKYNLSVIYNIKRPTNVEELDSVTKIINNDISNGDYLLDNYNIKRAALTKLKEKTKNNNITITDMKNFIFSKNGSKYVRYNKNNNNYQIIKDEALKLTETTDTPIVVTFTYNGQKFNFKYIIRYTVATTDGNGGTSGSTSGDSSTKPTEEASKCYFNKDMEKYEYITPTAAGKGKYELYKDSNGAEASSKEACLQMNEKSESTTTTDEATTGTNDNTPNGKNVCSKFKVSRVRAYNCTPGTNPYNGKPDGCSKLNNANLNFKDNYFQPVVAGLSSYYYVYKAYYDCEDQGFDSTIPITSFCVDPGLQGPYTSVGGTKTYNSYYSTETTLDKNSKFYKGLYRLYTNWYLKKDTKVANYYQGPNGEQGKEDFVDFIMDNVSRKLRLEYDTQANKTYISGGVLEQEFKDYSRFNLGTGSNSYAKKLVEDIWKDVTDFADNGVISNESKSSYTWTKTESDTTTNSDTSANIKITADSTVSPTKTNSGKGFSATVKFTVTGTDKTTLDSIIKDENNKIIVKTNKEEEIKNESLTIEKVGDWNQVENGYSITYKVSCDNVYNYISDTDFTSVMVGLQISYIDPYSIDNILILRTRETNGSAARLQDFVTFLNGKADKMANISIAFENEQKNICRPTFAMPCTTNENVYYLIEGTQSGALYNTIMNGIKGVGDLQNLISNAYNILQQLKNINLTDLGKNDLKIIMGTLENFANSGAILKTLNKEISGYLRTLANNGNSTAGLLLSNLNTVSFSNDAQTNFKNVTSLFIKVLMNGASKGTDSLSKDWDEIISSLETGVDKENVSDSTLSLVKNLGNAIKNSGTSLGKILQGAETLSNYFTSNFSNITDISSAIKAVEATIQGLVGDNSFQLPNILSSIKENMLDKLDLSSLLTSPSNWNIFETISNALIVDWDKCIIGEDGVEATDPNGNSYTIQQSNDNDYGMFCTITCKEDYAIKMPGNLGTTYAGRYISTNVDNVYHATIGMAGQRVCATTEIKNDKYVEAAKAKKDEMLKAYNNFYESYTKYKSLATHEKSDVRSNDANISSSIDKINTSEIKEKLISGIGVAITNTFSQFVHTVLPNEDAETIMNGFADEASDMIVKIGMMALQGSLTADNLSGTFSNYFDTKLEQYKEGLKAGLKNLVPNLLNNCQKVAGDILGTTVVNAAGAMGKVGLEFACNEGASILDLAFGAGEIVRTVCNIYSGVSTTFANTIININKSSQNKIFQIENVIDYDYTYHKYVYSDTTSDVTKLSSKFVESTGDTVSDTATSHGNRTTIWIMKNEGRFSISDLNYGSVVFNAISQVHKVAQSLQKLGNLDILKSGNFENQLNALVQTANKLGGNINIGWLKKNGESMNSDGFSGIVTAISDIMNIFTDITGTTDNILSDVTNAVDSALLVYYDFLGIFNPYYASLGALRHKMEDYKEEYSAAQDELSDLASRMNACTMWSNTYEFNPTIEFTYGYEKNSLIDYIVNKNNLTTDKVYLKDINKGEPENVSYYCDGDVDIKDVQNWDVITSGKCRTDDGMIGGLITSLASDDTLRNVLQVFKDNQTGLKKLLNNTKVKEFMQNNQYLDKISSFLCSGLGESFCDLFSSGEDGVVTTYVPGDIVYKAILSDGTTDTSSGIQSWKNLFGIIGGSGSLSFDNAISSITNKITYTTGAGYEVNYRNVGRVVNISRYGNPGVSVSGLSWTTILSNMASYLVNKSESTDTGDVLQKINNGVMSITGQGAQSFIYYKSSQQYWTSSNKGIYTKTKTADDSVLVDTGDPALTNDKYKSGTDADKQPDGLIYPIALSTKEGTYQYQIKINNVGQYYDNTTSLGRIIDDSGYVNGLLANQYVCKYEVKTEPDTPNDSCQEILESSDCKDENGYFKDLYKDQKNYTNTNGIDYESKWNACIDKLLAENNSCCYLIDSNNVPNASQDKYNNMCNSHCQGIKLLGSDGAIKDSTSGNSALISKNGVLQFYTKVVSNYDFFPNGNGSKGYNWSGYTSGYENLDENGLPQPQKVDDIRKDMEEVGDNTYADDDTYLDYKITLNGACMAKIKEYNDQQELNDLGFGDYTLGSISKESREYQSKFLKDLEENSEYASCQKAITNQLQK